MFLSQACYPETVDQEESLLFLVESETGLSWIDCGQGVRIFIIEAADLFHNFLQIAFADSQIFQP